MTDIEQAWLRDGQLIAFYLMTSYLYYICDKSIMSDADYDTLCKRLHKQWNKVQHPHKRLIDRKALGAGTGYYIRKEEYPLMTCGAATMLMNHCDASSVRNAVNKK